METNAIPPTRSTGTMRLVQSSRMGFPSRRKKDRRVEVSQLLLSSCVNQMVLEAREVRKASILMKLRSSGERLVIDQALVYPKHQQNSRIFNHMIKRNHGPSGYYGANSINPLMFRIQVFTQWPFWRINRGANGVRRIHSHGNGVSGDSLGE